MNKEDEFYIFQKWPSPSSKIAPYFANEALDCDNVREYEFQLGDNASLQ